MAKTATKKRNPKNTTKYDLRGLYRRVAELEEYMVRVLNVLPSAERPSAATLDTVAEKLDRLIAIAVQK